jgi:hypothetical protein
MRRFGLQFRCSPCGPNLHGGVIMGLAALGIFSTVLFAQDLYQDRGNRRARTLFAITGASALATVATPYGIGTWEAVCHALRNPYTRQVVKDWHPMHRTFLAIWHEVPGWYVLHRDHGRHFRRARDLLCADSAGGARIREAR